jgi:hypothetical protein
MKAALPTHEGDIVGSIWGIITGNVTETVYKYFISEVEPVLNKSNISRRFNNPYPCESSSPIKKITVMLLDRIRVRKNYMQAFNQIIISSGKASNMARAYFAYIASTWIRKREPVSKNMVDRIMFLTSQTKYFITLSVSKRLLEEVSMNEISDHACGVNSLPLCEHLTAEEIAFNIVKKDLVEPLLTH